jgi:CDP-diacylglycerol--glycerol-3-phosphate 3-phosphatidyltransferase
MALAPLAVWLIGLGADYILETSGVVLIMIFSDVLDGYLARRWGQITRWGKILDPLSDKVAIGSIAVVMVMEKGLPLWVVMVVLGRDALILLGSYFIVKKRNLVISSNIWGKLTTLVMSGLLLVYLWDVDGFKPFFLWSSAGLLGMSFVSYGRQFIRLYR